MSCEAQFEDLAGEGCRRQAIPNSNCTKYSDIIFPRGLDSSSGYFQSDWLCYFSAHGHGDRGSCMQLSIPT